MHLHYSGPDGIAYDLGLAPSLVKSFATLPKEDIVFAQKYAGGELAPGGSGYILKKPLAEMTDDERDKVEAFQKALNDGAIAFYNKFAAAESAKAQGGQVRS